MEAFTLCRMLELQRQRLHHIAQMRCKNITQVFHWSTGPNNELFFYHPAVLALGNSDMLLKFSLLWMYMVLVKQYQVSGTRPVDLQAFQQIGSFDHLVDAAVTHLENRTLATNTTSPLAIRP